MPESHSLSLGSCASATRSNPILDLNVGPAKSGCVGAACALLGGPVVYFWLPIHHPGSAVFALAQRPGTWPTPFRCMSAPGSGGPSPAPIAGDADFAAAGAAEPPPAPPNEPTPGPSSNPPPPPNPNAAGIGGPPRIVPTKVAPDGVREVPRRFEQCEVEDLIQLIGALSTLLCPLLAPTLTREATQLPCSIV